MPTPRNKKNLQKNMLLLGERLNNIRHQETGRPTYPKISNNTNFVDTVSLDDVLPFNAWYIAPNTVGTNKVHQVYNRATLNAILAQPPPRRVSPATRKPFTAADIRRLWNHFRNVTANNVPAQAPAPALAQAHVINLTHNNNQPAHHVQHAQQVSSAPRPRRNVPFTQAIFRRFVDYMRTHTIHAMTLKIKTNDPRASHRSIYIDKTGSTNMFRIRTGHPYVVHHNNIAYPAIVNSLMTFTQAQFPPTARYMGYETMH